MVVYNFRSLKVVPTGPELLDIVLSRTQRKTATQVHKRFAISRIRSFYMMKVKFTQSTFHERISQIVDEFPRLESIHPFYADLINVLYDRDHYKLALGQLNTARSLIDNIAKDYVRLLKFGDSLYRCKLLKRAALGRMATVIKKLKASLAYLEQVRQHLSRLPSIDPNTRTLMLTGYPNVGKSSFINKITRADVDVQPYAFTTKSLFVGHLDYKYLRWQVLDTPGILDHPLEQRNTIEMQAVTALAHLNSAVLFLIDISGASEYSIEQQVSLFHNLRPLFSNKPIFVVANKTDVRHLNDLEEDEKKQIETIRALNVPILEMSNLDESGVMDVKNAACDALLQHRVARKVSSNHVDKVRHRIHIAKPKPRDNRERPVHIPDSVLQQRARASSDAMSLEPKRTSLREIEAKNGGAGVFNVDLREHWQLDDEDWKQDIVPEIFNGRNVADFFSADIEARLNALEAEEEEIEETMAGEDEDVESDLDDETMKLSKKIEEKKKMLLVERRFNRNLNSSIMPRPNRAPRTSKQFVKHLKQLGIQADGLSVLRSRKRKRRSLADSDEMVDMDDGEDDKNRRSRSLSRSRSRSRSRAVSVAKETSISDEGRAKATKIARKNQKFINLAGKAGVADRAIRDKMPKHLFSGKRGIGKTDRR